MPDKIDPNDPIARARQSEGSSSGPILAAVLKILAGRHNGGGTLLDVGCGKGNLWPILKGKFDRYLGSDVFRYEEFPSEGSFHLINLATGRVELPDASADVVCAVETIEHVENPRALARELTRLAKPGGWIVVTTPNQLSWLSKLTLVICDEFNAFRAGSYPAHLTALLTVDLRRIAGECGWTEVIVEYTKRGRIPGTGRNWPTWISRLSPKRFSDNVLIAGRVSTPRDQQS
jgi:SAM-dependent methyltransferase